MAFLCIRSGGSEENYVLNLSVSRHNRNFLQIDEVSFGKYQ